jgi:hypothetical protein
MSEKKKNLYRSLILVVPILLGLAVTQLVLASGRMQEPEPTLDPPQARIETLQTALQEPRLDAQARQSLQEKLDMAVRIATQKAVAAEVTPVQSMDQATSTPYPTPNLEAGIFEGSDGIIRPSQAAVQNGWQGSLDGNIVQVFAGADAVDATRGVLIVISPASGQTGRTMKVYSAPEPHGWLRIEAAVDGIFDLVSEDGVRYQFNLRSETYSAAAP